MRCSFQTGGEDVSIHQYRLLCMGADAPALAKSQLRPGGRPLCKCLFTTHGITADCTDVKTRVLASAAWRAMSEPLVSLEQDDAHDHDRDAEHDDKRVSVLPPNSGILSSCHTTRR